VGLAGIVSRNLGGVGDADATACLDSASTADVSHESKPSSIDTVVSRWLESIDGGLYNNLWLLLISFDFELMGRTTWEREDRKEDMVSDPARERPLDDGGDFDSIEGEPR
jgi:hypothetical protein